MAVLLSDLFGMAQLSMITALFVRNQAFPEKMRANRLMSVFAVWLGGSTVRSTFTKTGAFEVFKGQTLVWSSVKNEGKPPTMKDLTDAFAKVGMTLQPKTR